MNKLTIAAFIIACMAVAAGCGNKSTTAAITTNAAFSRISGSSTFTVISTASGDQLGGNVQKGPFAFKQNNYSTVVSPVFRNVSSAAFNGPIAATTYGSGHYVVNFISHNILKVDSAGAVTNFAGLGIAGFANNSTSRKAIFSSPTAISTDGGALYIADTGNNAIRKIATDGTVSLLAGVAGTAGSDDTNTSLAVVAKFNQPTGVTVVGTNVFVADYNNHTIRMVDTTTTVGTVTTFAGKPGVAGSTDGDRQVARFNHPGRITSDGKYLYVTDFGNRTVRRISLRNGAVDTIAGRVGVSGITNGTKGTSLFRQPNGIATDGMNVYVTDAFEGTGNIRRIELTSGFFNTTTVMDGFKTPIGITTNGSGLFITDRESGSIIRIK